MSEQPAHDAATTPSRPPLVAIAVIFLLGHYLITFPDREPYPSVAMPGFAGISPIDDDPELIPVAFLRIEGPTGSALLSREQLFASAPINQRHRMIQRFDEMTGTDEEWRYLDAVGQTFGVAGIGESVESAESVRRTGYGAERVVVRIERTP